MIQKQKIQQQKSAENIDSFLQNLDEPYINKETSYCDLEFENFCDLIFILNNIDVQPKSLNLKIKKKKDLEEIIRLTEITRPKETQSNIGIETNLKPIQI